MRKFFDRLRRWLIKKLGGYAERPMPEKWVMWQTDVQVQEFQAQINMTLPPPENEDYFRRFCKSRLTEKLMECLEESACIRWETAFDKAEQKVNIRAKLYAVNAADLPPHYKCGTE